MRRPTRAVLTAGLGVWLACSSSGSPIFAEPGDGIAVGPAAALAFHQRADAFYQRLIRRRFNALETFNDPLLHQHFRTRDRFLDYYADLATALDGANFEKSRPRRVAVEEFLFESPTRVRVQVRFVGDDDRPLNPTRSTLVRVDRWERTEGNWWISPGKL